MGTAPPAREAVRSAAREAVERAAPEVGQPRLARLGRLGGLRRLRPDPTVQTAAALWLASKVAIVALGWIASWIMRPSYRHPLRFSFLWEHWDATQFRIVAEYGYFGPPGTSNPGQVAFFPGYPLLLRGVHLLIPNWTGAEVAIGTAASFFAVLGLVRLAEDYQLGSGRWAGLFLLAAPAAVFLAVGYSEALFLAFALPAWLAARRGAWIRASLYAAGASAVRVNGLFLVAGLVVMALLAKDAASRRSRLAALLTIPLVPVTAYTFYLYEHTGDWLAWQHAEERDWRRHFGNPVTTFRTTWQVAADHLFRTPLAFAFQLELVAVALLLITIIAMLWRRHWPEACYTALTTAALVAAHWYFSVPRAVLLVFPLWCGLARLAWQRLWLAGLWLGVSVPLMFVTALLYFSGRWAG